MDTEIPSKATKLTGHTRSRSTSVSTTGGDDASSVVAAAKPRVGGGAVRSSKALTASKSSSAVLEGAQRQTARLPRPAGPTTARVAKSGSFHDGRLEVHEEEEAGGEDVAMKSEDALGPARPVAAGGRHRDSGLTPSLNDMNVVGGAGAADAQQQQQQQEVIEITDDEDMADDPPTTERYVTLPPAMLARIHAELAEEKRQREEAAAAAAAAAAEAEEDADDDEDNWMTLTREQQLEVAETLHRVRESFEDEIDFHDTTMVAEYSDDIFAYMEELEETALPSATYMDHQSEIEW